jgi:hypothetical protein
MSSFPVATQSLTIAAGAKQLPTQLIISTFANLLFIFISQTDAISSITCSDLHDSRILLGDRDNLESIVVCREIEKLAGRKVVLALSLRDSEGVMKGTSLTFLQRYFEWIG